MIGFKRHTDLSGYLTELQLGAVLGQCGVQELVLLCGLDHAPPVQHEGATAG